MTLTRLYLVHYIATKQQGYIVDRPQGWSIETKEVEVEQTMEIRAGDACQAMKWVLQRLMNGRAVISGTEARVRVQATGEEVIVKQVNGSYQLKDT